MPIIKPRRGVESKAAPSADVTQPKSEPQPELQTDSAGAVTFVAKQKKSRPSIIFYISALFLGILLPIVAFNGYVLWTQAKIDKQVAAAEAERQSIDISNDIDIYKKVSTLASLTKREFELNLVALTEAQKHTNSVVFASLEVIVNKNRQDLARYKERLVEILLAINGSREINAEAIREQIVNRIADAEIRESNESARLLTLLNKMLDGVPEGTELKLYFQAAIEDSL